MTRVTAVPAALVLLAVMLLPALGWGQSDAPSEIQRQIDAHNAQITALDKEIAQYQVQLDAVGSKKKTLQNTLSQLDLSIKKATASINATKNKISATQLEIQQLARGIAGKQASINTGEAGIGESIRQLHEYDTEPLIVQMLSSADFTDVWTDVDANQTLQKALNEQIGELASEKQSLTDTKVATEAKKAELVKQQNTLVAQQGSLNAQKKAQSELLVQTKSQESTYQAILAQKQSAKASFEAALTDLKAQFQHAVNPSEILTAGKGILRWPLDNVRITQNFGNTAFAQSGAYNGKGHNGVDLAAPIGTPIKAALTGTVLGTGNTDSVRGCYSFGRWIMLKHANGLNTMYSHLSQVSVATGQSVATGALIGYSGETGYATGPHLHFGVYVTSATQIVKLSQATNKTSSCSNAIMPVAPLSGYLNPMNYL
ncbi:MAG: peptidoglycan DD-metalloendopeptidase family protein [bacterium]|nr:peptidoglycan DD-metalloendopeptidase family protein [bacterium]